MQQQRYRHGSARPVLILVAATTGYQTRSFAAAASRLDIDVVLATDRCHVLEDPWADHAIPIQFDEPSQAAERIAAAWPQARGIVAVADGPTLVAALAAERLGLPFHPPSGVRICRNKHLMREAFRSVGLPVPPHILLPVGDDPVSTLNCVEYPCVLKPLGLSASRGVIRANNPDEALQAFERIQKILRTPDLARVSGETNRQVQLERYIPGREFAVEGLLRDGTLTPLAIFDKPDPLEGPFFEETIYVTPSRETMPVQENILSAAARAASAIGLTDGPMHAEMRVNGEGVWMLEVAARPIGGLCARTLRFSTGNSPIVTLEELAILHAIGRLPERLEPAAPASGVMMLPVPRAGIFQNVTGTEGALAVPGIVDLVVTAKQGQRLVPLPEGASYTGFVFAESNTPDAVEQALRTAHSCLRFEILSALDVLPA